MDPKLTRTAAFTLIEIIVVVILLGVLAGMALPRYHRAVARQQEQDAINQLRAVHEANEMYRIRARVYLPQSGSNDHVTLNTGLGINIIPNGKSYTYSRPTTTTYTTTACISNPGGGCYFSVRINQAALSNNNPSCVAAGTCPTLP